MGLALPLAILAAAAAYQFTRRADLSLVLFAAFAALSLTVWADNWQLCWLNPCVWALSDDFSNFRLFRSVAYMRLTWLAALAGVWTVSYLCIRQYGKGILGSLARSVRRVYRPAVALAPAGLLRHRLCRPALHRQQQPGSERSCPSMSCPTPEGVTCSQPHRPGVPGHRRRYGDRPGLLPVPEHLRPGADASPSASTRATTISTVQANGTDVPFTVRATTRSTMRPCWRSPSRRRRQVELATGVRRLSPGDWNTAPPCRADKEISGEYLCLENAALSPRPAECAARRGGLSRRRSRSPCPAP